MEEEKKVKNPYQVLYLNPHIHSQKFAKMAAKYHQERELAMLQQVAAITGLRLLESPCINWRQRLKFAANGFQVGRKKYYLLPS